jgi:uncharacterized membrane protein YraQ (UPF0718 family)
MEFFVEKIIEYFVSIFPWILLGSVIDYTLGRFIRLRYIVAYLQKPTPVRIFVVNIFGMLSPFTTMSFLPIANKLIKRGAHVGLILGFLSSERAYGIQSFFIISALFSVKIALLHLLVLVFSLFIASLFVRGTDSLNKNTDITDVAERHVPATAPQFLIRQLKIYALVLIGVVLAAGLDAFVPAELVAIFSDNFITSLVGALVFSLIIYLGTIFGNYPVAASFLDLGIPLMSVFVFLVLSPLFNIVTIILLASSVRTRYVLKFVALYSLTGFGLSILAAVLFF